MKDLFIDNNIAIRLANPVTREYKELVEWLIYNQEAFLVTCNKLIQEYGHSGAYANSAACIWVILDKLTREGRRNHISNQSIKSFKQKYYILNYMTLQ